MSNKFSESQSYLLSIGFVRYDRFSDLDARAYIRTIDEDHHELVRLFYDDPVNVKTLKRMYSKEGK